MWIKFAQYGPKKKKINVNKGLSHTVCPRKKLSKFKKKKKKKGCVYEFFFLNVVSFIMFI